MYFVKYWLIDKASSDGKKISHILIQKLSLKFCHKKVTFWCLLVFGMVSDYTPNVETTGIKCLTQIKINKIMAEVKIKPLADRVLIEPMAAEQKTASGIIIPDTAKEKPIEGQVVAVGSGKILENGKVRPLDVKAGDRVLFGKYSGSDVRIEGEEHLILREDEILAVMEK